MISRDADLRYATRPAGISGHLNLFFGLSREAYIDQPTIMNTQENLIGGLPQIMHHSPSCSAPGRAITDEDIIGMESNHDSFPISDIDVKIILYEISGRCNARCPFCPTGSGRLNEHASRFIPVEEFRDGINRLYELNFLKKDTQVGLYNWGDPLLHPELEKIMSVLTDVDLNYSLSSNGSRFVPVSPMYLDNLAVLRFSLPGFSQQSYDRVHGLQFGKVLEHIRQWIEVLPDFTVEIAYFLYNFNYSEMKAAFEYFSDLKVVFNVKMPFLMDFYDASAVLSGRSNPERMEEISKYLHLEYIDAVKIQQPGDYLCPLLSSQLVIDEYNNVVTCCAISKTSNYYSLGSLISLDREQILGLKSSVPICRGCTRIGLPYWFTTADEWLPGAVLEHYRKDRDTGRFPGSGQEGMMNNRSAMKKMLSVLKKMHPG